MAYGDRGLVTGGFRGMGMTRDGQAEEDERQHANHGHHATHGPGSGRIDGQRRELGLHVLVLRQLLLSSTSHPARRNALDNNLM